MKSTRKMVDNFVSDFSSYWDSSRRIWYVPTPEETGNDTHYTSKEARKAL